MTRKLTVKQKKMLDELIKAQPDACCHQDLPKSKVKNIASLNDNELVWQQMNRYIWDKQFERKMSDTSNPFMG